MNNFLVWGGVTLFILTAGFAVFYSSIDNVDQGDQPDSAITSFEECVEAGYPVLESYPEQCRTPDGKSFVRDISEEEPSSTELPESEEQPQPEVQPESSVGLDERIDRYGEALAEWEPIHHILIDGKRITAEWPNPGGNSRTMWKPPESYPEASHEDYRERRDYFTAKIDASSCDMNALHRFITSLEDEETREETELSDGAENLSCLGEITFEETSFARD